MTVTIETLEIPGPPWLVPVICPLKIEAKECTMDECFNLNDPDAQRRCSLC